MAQDAPPPAIAVDIKASTVGGLMIESRVTTDPGGGPDLLALTLEIRPDAPDDAMTRARNCDRKALGRRYAFGSAVRAARQSVGLSQERLGELAGCDRQSVNRIENAAYAPSLDRLWLLADALGVPLADLFAAADKQLNDTAQVAR